MKSTTWTVTVAWAAFLCGLVLGAMLFGNSAIAQNDSARTSGPYQISAYAGTTPEGVNHGCYIVDSSTGQVWYARLGGAAEKVSDNLP
jgi:hypothetical protein